MWGSLKFLGLDSLYKNLVLDSGLLPIGDSRWFLEIFGVELTLVISAWWRWDGDPVGPLGLGRT